MVILKQQNGAALVAVIMVLLVLTLLGSSAFLTSFTELKISSNYNQSLQALYAAEAGLQALLSVYRQNPVYFLEKKTGSEMNFPVDEPDHPNGSGTKFWIKELRYDSKEIPAYAEVILYGKNSDGYSLARLRATIACTQSNDDSDIPEIFKLGIVTAGRLNLNGPLSIVGNLHANQGFSIEPSSILEELRSQQFSVTQSMDPSRPDYRPAMEVPLISENGFQTYRTIAGQPGNQTLFGQQDLLLSGDQKGLIIFVDGNVTLQGNNLSGVTLVVTGSITINGVTVLNKEGSLDAAFIAGGDIKAKEFSQLAGVFWANGSIKNLGSGKMTGAMVCQGDVSQKEGFQFERVSRISNPILNSAATPYTFTLSGWSQI